MGLPKNQTHASFSSLLSALTIEQGEDGDWERITLCHTPHRFPLSCLATSLPQAGPLPASLPSSSTTATRQIIEGGTAFQQPLFQFQAGGGLLLFTKQNGSGISARTILRLDLQSWATCWGPVHCCNAKVVKRSSAVLTVLLQGSICDWPQCDTV